MEVLILLNGTLVNKEAYELLMRQKSELELLLETVEQTEFRLFPQFDNFNEAGQHWKWQHT